ncbi:unnamed protein product [Natator depressus]
MVPPSSHSSSEPKQHNHCAPPPPKSQHWHCEPKGMLISKEPVVSWCCSRLLPLSSRVYRGFFIGRFSCPQETREGPSANFHQRGFCGHTELMNSAAPAGSPTTGRGNETD